MTIKIKKPGKPEATGDTAPAKVITRERDKYKRIAEMPADKRAAMDNMFYEGVSVAKIVTSLKDGWGLFTDIKETTLTKFLYRYKWDVIDKNLVARTGTIDEQKRIALLEKVATEIDVIEEVAQLVSTQKVRVQKLLNRENDMPMLFNQLGAEMKTLSGFIQQYADLSFDFGVVKRAKKITTVHTENGTTVVESDGKDQVMFALESSKKVEKAAQTFFDALKVIEGEVVGDVNDDSP